MTDRENNVYKAKLAEQAERYDGKLISENFSTCRKDGDFSSEKNR